MPDAQQFQPDAAYCVYCHAQAAGACASCRALVCGDCSALVTGAGGKSYAVCKECDERGVLTLGRVAREIGAAALPLLAAAAVLALLAWFVTR